ncbi:tripartite tricarboxylate transporter substrate binding protein [Neorhizobium lilium]|uniref:Tripartite tricarboxylate transporter substrate binding protein n=1 Tax=Neorhizobium lilium TaxID=2503024 RepID=A0A444LAQ9_9HYPH|nr:tripartite tricarboxylate transporter substrate binding protein [Neorhizobium lilium]RWX74704.1 tripartite tricarboxylate transporter substrate binding protein [Neorhizobium lilium]
MTADWQCCAMTDLQRFFSVAHTLEEDIDMHGKPHRLTGPFRRNVLRLGAVLGIWGASFSPGQAETFPEKPITIIVPFNAGGAADATGRILAEALSRQLGVNVLVENIGGAGGAIGTTRVKAAEPDGYTIGLGHIGTLAAAVPMNPKLQYDPRSDFRYLGLVSSSPNVLYVSKNHPSKTLQEFIAYSKAHKTGPAMGHGGQGAASHVACVMFFKQIGVTPNLVAYKGFGQTITDILSERIDGGCDLLASVAPHAKSGDLRVLAVAADKRSPILPNAMTAAEGGLPEFKTETWTGLFVPKDAPDAVVERLEQAIAAALEDAGVHDRLNAIGASLPEVGQRGGVYMQQLVGTEIDKWTSILGN